MEQSDNEQLQSPQEPSDTDITSHFIPSKRHTSFADISWPPTGSPGGAAALAGEHARRIQPPLLRKSPAATLNRGTHPLRRSNNIRLSSSTLPKGPLPGEAQVAASTGAGQGAAAAAGEPTSNNGATDQSQQRLARRSSTNSRRATNNSRDHEIAENSKKAIVPRRVSVTRALASLHNLNKEHQGAERFGAVLVCCIAALFLGHLVVGRMMFGRRKKTVGNNV